MIKVYFDIIQRFSLSLSLSGIWEKFRSYHRAIVQQNCKIHTFAITSRRRHVGLKRFKIMAENKIVDPVPEPPILSLPFDNFVSLARTRDCLGLKHARCLLFPAAYVPHTHIHIRTSAWPTTMIRVHSCTTERRKKYVSRCSLGVGNFNSDEPSSECSSLAGRFKKFNALSSHLSISRFILFRELTAGALLDPEEPRPVKSSGIPLRRLPSVCSHNRRSWLGVRQRLGVSKLKLIVSRCFFSVQAERVPNKERESRRSYERFARVKKSIGRRTERIKIGRELF